MEDQSVRCGVDIAGGYAGREGKGWKGGWVDGGGRGVLVSISHDAVSLISVWWSRVRQSATWEELIQSPVLYNSDSPSADFFATILL